MPSNTLQPSAMISEQEEVVRHKIPTRFLADELMGDEADDHDEAQADEADHEEGEEGEKNVMIEESAESEKPAVSGQQQQQNNVDLANQQQIAAELLPLVTGEPASANGQAGMDLVRCIGVTDAQCRAKFQKNQITWTTKIVDKLPEDPKQQTAQMQIPPMNPPSSQTTVPARVFSSDPTVAKLQKQFYDKQDEITREQDWVNKVKGIVRIYNEKATNVQRALRSKQNQLKLIRHNIVKAIKNKKQTDLGQQLQTAISAMKQLQDTHKALTLKMGDLTQTRRYLTSTISQIKTALQGKGAKGSLLETSEAPLMNSLLEELESHGKKMEEEDDMGADVPSLMEEEASSSSTPAASVVPPVTEDDEFLMNENLDDENEDTPQERVQKHIESLKHSLPKHLQEMNTAGLDASLQSLLEQKSGHKANVAERTHGMHPIAGFDDRAFQQKLLKIAMDNAD